MPEVTDRLKRKRVSLMCSQYHVDDEVMEALKKTAGIVEQDVLSCYWDIRPSDRAVVIDGSTPELRLRAMNGASLNLTVKGPSSTRGRRQQRRSRRVESILPVQSKYH